MQSVAGGRAHLARIALHYWARSSRHAAFLERIRSSSFAGRTSFHFSDETKGRSLVLPDLLANPDLETHVYICGPDRFMDAALAAAKSAGWPDSNVHREYFGAEVSAGPDDREFTVKIASSGKSYRVEKGVTALKVLTDHGIILPRSCEQGVCGTCLTGVLNGIPEHRDRILTKEERDRNDRFTPCCSRATSDEIVLDL